MLFMLLLSAALAQETSVGEVLQGEAITVQRQGATLQLKTGDDLESGDRLESSGAQVLLFPSNQMNLEGAVTLEEVSDAQTNIKLEKGRVHINVDSEKAPQQFRLKTPMAVFGVRGTEFEVEDSSEGVDLQVLDGMVEADDLSGSVQQVKPREAFRKMRGEKGWKRREFRERKRRFAFLRREDARERRELKRNSKFERIKERVERRRRR